MFEHWRSVRHSSPFTRNEKKNQTVCVIGFRLCLIKRVQQENTMCTGVTREMAAALFLLPDVFLSCTHSHSLPQHFQLLSYRHYWQGVLWETSEWLLSANSGLLCESSGEWTVPHKLSNELQLVTVKITPCPTSPRPPLGLEVIVLCKNALNDALGK